MVGICGIFFSLFIGLQCTELLPDAAGLFSRRNATGHLKPDNPSYGGTARHLPRARCPENVAGAWRQRTALRWCNGPTPDACHFNLCARGVAENASSARSLACVLVSLSVTAARIYSTPHPCTSISTLQRQRQQRRGRQQQRGARSPRSVCQACKSGTAGGLGA